MPIPSHHNRPFLCRTLYYPLLSPPNRRFPRRFPTKLLHTEAVFSTPHLAILYPYEALDMFLPIAKDSRCSSVSMVIRQAAG
jgi:hypothetical protein